MSADGDPPSELISRRALLGRVSAAGAAAALPEILTPAGTAAQSPRPVAREPLETLTAGEAETLEAIAARLIPSDPASPGAAEARAAHYIDRALGGALAAFRDVYRAGLAAVEAHARASRGTGFTQLAPNDQDAVLTAMERNGASGFDGGSAAFFSLVLAHTLQGTFGDPYYGGNRNFVGWDLIGYPGVRLAVSGAEQNLDAKLTPTRMGAYDYSMFSRRTPARADRATAHEPHGD
jgi:gluconate 2-dehydrogenase gamma chain